MGKPPMIAGNDISLKHTHFDGLRRRDGYYKLSLQIKYKY